MGPKPGQVVPNSLAKQTFWCLHLVAAFSCANPNLKLTCTHVRDLHRCVASPAQKCSLTTSAFAHQHCYCPLSLLLVLAPLLLHQAAEYAASTSTLGGHRGPSSAPALSSRNIFALFRTWMKKLGGQAALQAAFDSSTLTSGGVAGAAKLLDLPELMSLLHQVSQGGCIRIYC